MNFVVAGLDCNPVEPVTVCQSLVAMAITRCKFVDPAKNSLLHNFSIEINRGEVKRATFEYPLTLRDVVNGKARDIVQRT